MATVKKVKRWPNQKFILLSLSFFFQVGLLLASDVGGSALGQAKKALEAYGRCYKEGEALPEEEHGIVSGLLGTIVPPEFYVYFKPCESFSLEDSRSLFSYRTCDDKVVFCCVDQVDFDSFVWISFGNKGLFYLLKPDEAKEKLKKFAG
ncbi:hypothetical protein HN446_02175 [bacterium]|jgi:hypothetical protein|nr:hypothetical protein [bacterium]